MVSPLFSSHLALLALVWLFMMVPLTWPQQGLTTFAVPAKLRRPPTNEPTLFDGLTHKPPGALGEQEVPPPQAPPAVRPEPMPPTNRRPRARDTSQHFGPHRGWHYRGWLGLNTLRANGHPRGGPWRQGHCIACQGYCLAPPGPLVQGPPAAVELIVRVLAGLAEGLGRRATARVFAGAPHRVLSWLVEAAAPLRACARYLLCDGHVEQGQRDEVYAVLRDLKAGARRTDEAMARLERAPSWGWTAMAAPAPWPWRRAWGLPCVRCGERAVGRGV